MSQQNVEIVQAMYEVANATGRLGANFAFPDLDREARGRDGMEVTLQLANLWTVRNGQIVRMEAFSDQRKALEAVGLSE